MQELPNPRPSEVVWRWDASQEPPPGPRYSPASRLVLQVALLLCAAAVLLGLGRAGLAVLAALLAACAALTYALARPAYERMDALGRLLGRGLGVGLTWLLLAPFYYLCFLPARVYLALTGRDPLDLAFPAPGSSCWRQREPREGSDSLERQY